MIPVLVHGDCVEVMQALPAGGIGTIVTDPPYGLEFMARDFDCLVPRWQNYDDVPASWREDYERDDDVG